MDSGCRSVQSGTEVRALRHEAMQGWLKQLLGVLPALIPVCGDASGRSYFRFKINGLMRVVMDAPPPGEQIQSFVRIAKALASKGVLVPEIFAVDASQGFVLMSDLGSKVLLGALTSQSVDAWYGEALGRLGQWLDFQLDDPVWSLPTFDEAMLAREWHVFEHWYVTCYSQQTLGASKQAKLAAIREQIFAAVLAQPQAWMHRDFHARNLMCLPGGRLGVLDFQDACWGPVTYDVVSLLKDAYVAWPRARVVSWATLHWAQHIEPRFALSQSAWLRAFDWMGVQRHLKVLGIFARLALHFGKPEYQADIPRVKAYLSEMLAVYPELECLAEFL